MGYGIKFRSRNNLREVISKAEDPVVKAMAEAVLSTYEIHMTLEKALNDSIELASYSDSIGILQMTPAADDASFDSRSTDVSQPAGDDS
jgi:hypothetical protein